MQERCKKIVEKNEKNANNSAAPDEAVPEGRAFLDKTLDAALDSFDNLFCRRCLVGVNCTDLLYLATTSNFLIRLLDIFR